MKILIAVDGSSHSFETMRFGVQFALQAGEIPQILKVQKSRRTKQDLIEDILKEARQILNMPDLQLVIRSGKPDEEILKEAQEGEYDLVVLGEREAPDWIRRIRGSISLEVATRAQCSSVIVKGPSRQVNRILLCDSGAGRSSVLSRFITDLTRILEGEEDITVLHVMSQISAGPGVPGRQLRATVDELISEHTPEGELLGKDLKALEQPGIHPTAKVRHGMVVEEILDEAKSGNYDLIVIGAHNHQKWQRYLLEDIASKLLAQSKQPILVVK